MKDHRRLICDTAAFMECTYHSVFFFALVYRPKGSCRMSKDDAKIANDEAAALLEKFMDTDVVPGYIEEFCINILTERIPIFNDKGKQVKRSTL